jgi:hypothetical protein
MFAEKNAATFDRGIFPGQTVNERLPRPAPIAVASVIVVAAILLETLLITLQETLAVSLRVGLFVEVGPLRIVALPALSIVGARVKTVLVALVYGSLVVTGVAITSAPILAVVTVVAIITSAVNVIVIAPTISIPVVVAVAAAAIAPVIAVSIVIISIPIPITVLPIASPAILSLCRSTRDYSNSKQQRNCEEYSPDSAFI